LVREHHIEKARVASWALYLVLVTVGDEHGVSYYADRTLARMLGLSLEQIQAGREELVKIGVLAYASPMYQVLDMGEELP
jgi:hypothetical protein